MKTGRDLPEARVAAPAGELRVALVAEAQTAAERHQLARIPGAHLRRRQAVHDPGATSEEPHSVRRVCSASRPPALLGIGHRVFQALPRQLGEASADESDLIPHTIWASSEANAASAPVPWLTLRWRV